MKNSNFKYYLFFIILLFIINKYLLITINVKLFSKYQNEKIILILVNTKRDPMIFYISKSAYWEIDRIRLI
jgi:hypothetical protein